MNLIRNQVMRRGVLTLLLSAALVLGTSRLGHATIIFVDTSIGGGQVGGFYGPYMPAEDAPVGYPPIIPPDNDPTFQNYFIGRTTTSPVATGFTTPERRVFFMFDMAGVSIPAGEVVTSLTIDLELLPGGTSALANFTGDVELVDFSSTPYSAAEILDPDSFAIAYPDIWATFGEGIPYGGFELIGPSHPSLPPTMADTHTIPLPGAIPDLTAAISDGDIFIVTAKLATFDPDPIGSLAPPAIDPYEYVFGLTDVVSGGGSLTAAPELVITTAAVSQAVIPEPSSFFLLGIGMLGLIRRLRRLV